MDQPSVQQPLETKSLFRHPFRRKNYRLRVLLPAAAGLAVILLAEPTRTTALLGLPLVLAGCLLRVWAAGHLVKTAELSITGPYAHLRHPFYAGTLTISAGLVIFAGGWVTAVALPALLAVFFGYYYPYKEREESARLEKHYGARYQAYRAAVHGLRPSLQAWAGASGGTKWQFARFRENSEIGTQEAVALAVVLIALHPLF